MSKLDRVLVSMEFMSYWPNGTFSALDRGLSDHCPILLECDNVDFGPQPFRFFNSWLKHPQLYETVSQAIQNFDKPNLPPDKTLALKLKSIKVAIKAWRALEIDKEHGELNLWQSQIRCLELKAESGQLSVEEVQMHGDLNYKITLHHQRKTMDLKQKAKARWAVDGDENSTYFHGLFKAHSSTNRINGISKNGTWISSPSEIKQEAFNYFMSKFQELNQQKPPFTVPGIARLSD
ncbi:hypothetical protein QVD17_12515 [Tagetes erecta]|uniref:Uncharacterized protein n=1 Tax=Tagetes erecta TaxID=13708 RepID=A0AAD8KZ18_TARER|nr:hypothetical protein QVD17_12515 [Tagetes erecta]